MAPRKQYKISAPGTPGRSRGGTFTKGNKFATGANAYGKRADSILQVGIDTVEMGQHARRISNLALSTNKPFLDAQNQLAAELQSYIAGALIDRVRDTGRAQRKKPSQDRLVKAIESKRNRKVTVDGYSVGYLDSIAAVRPYWRGLEIGSHRHVGRIIHGSFLSSGGKLVRPVEGGKDPRFIQFKNKTYKTLREQVADRPNRPGGRTFGANAQTLGVRIKNPIPAYRYFETGIRNFTAQGFTRDEARRVYAQHLEAFAPDLAKTLTDSSKAIGKRYDKGLTDEAATPTPNPRT